MNDHQQLLNTAMSLHQSGRIADAIVLYDRLLPRQMGNAQLLFMAGTAYLQTGRMDKGLTLIRGSLAIQPNNPLPHNSIGLALHSAGKREEALASFDRALGIYPGFGPAHNNRGNVLHALMRLDEAVAAYDKALAINPGDAQAWYNRAIVLLDLKRWSDALASCDRALAIAPGFAQAQDCRGNALRALNRPLEALAAYDKAIALHPGFAEAYGNRGNALRDLRRLDEALASYGKVLAIHPDNAEAYYNRGQALQDQGRPREALADFKKALAINPGHRYAFGALADAALRLCDWTRMASPANDVDAHVRAGRAIIEPLTVLGYSDDAALHLQCARSSIRDEVSAPKRHLWDGKAWRNDRIRIAYLSADFHEHATAWLTAELFEKHDRQRFHITAISYGADDGSPMRARLVKAFDQFIDVNGKSDADVAQLLRDQQIDIAVDLKGHTQGSRPGILSFRPAPVAVNYLGYPGTMGAPFIDYVIADAIVLPFAQQPFYDEQIVHLPHTYQANDSRREIAQATPSRSEAGLPGHGFVFCCFNNSRKITQKVFEIWMRLLAAVPGSVLWLLDDNDAATANLKAAARERGINPARLVFAPRTGLPEHLARHRLADLFLDTLPYNAHTTASDALWAGLPVLTCQGSTFAGRVAASLLHAIGLQELVTDTVQAYEELAAALARDPQRLAALRARLEQNRRTHPLFDTDKFRRDIEKAYLTMWETSQRGDAPKAFAVNG
jgi:predicted O-linked N-acetylglucosamine transferase (SPINDLY family)